MRSFYKNSRLVGLALLGLVVLLPACTRRSVASVGTHTVTVMRHGFEKRLQVNDQAPVPTFEYVGMSTDGKGMKVSIRGDKITVNGAAGELKPGDKVLIGDDGVAVNSLDYGETEKYLRANSSVSDTSALK
jgi:hypothetical protein